MDANQETEKVAAVEIVAALFFEVTMLDETNLKSKIQNPKSTHRFGRIVITGRIISSIDAPPCCIESL